MAEVVERLVGHPAGQRAVADHRDHPAVPAMADGLAPQLERAGEPVGVGERGRGVAVLDPVVLGLGPVGVAGQPALLPEFPEAVPPAGQELVDVGLVAGVPQDGVAG